VEDFNIPFSSIDGSSRPLPPQKINKETNKLIDMIDQMDLTSIHRVFHPAAAQYTFFSAAHGIFSKIDHILGHKANLSKCKKVEITPCILSDHKG
jgi:exonuclease III